MAVQTLPLSIDLTVYSGTSYERRFRWKPAGVAQDFTDWTARMRIGVHRGPATTELSTPTDIALGTDGLITIDLSPAVTAHLPAGTSFYQLDLIDPTGEILRFLRGRLMLIRDLESGP